MLFDLDDAKKQFVHSYPLLTVNIEAPFAANVKIIIRNGANGCQLKSKPIIISQAI
jgi:hypothetical protein